uniref:Uncharacterized protein n=1 Tax=Zea mays TaxID=4577 RepID=C4IZA8_MAIZE|nr:unknown [Zea mays]
MKLYPCPRDMMAFSACNRPLPNLRAELTSSRGHPFPRVVHALADLPPWNVFHDPRLLLKTLLPLFDKSFILFCLEHRQYSTASSNFLFFERPADLVPLADLVHAICESTEGGEEDGGGAGPRGGDPAGEAHGRETARRRPVLHHRHLLDAGHPRLVPHQGLRHLRSRIRTPVRTLGGTRAPRGDQTSRGCR